MTAEDAGGFWRARTLQASSSLSCAIATADACSISLIIAAVRQIRKCGSRGWEGTFLVRGFKAVELRRLVI